MLRVLLSLLAVGAVATLGSTARASSPAEPDVSEAERGSPSGGAATGRGERSRTASTESTLAEAAGAAADEPKGAKKPPPAQPPAALDGPRGERPKPARQDPPPPAASTRPPAAAATEPPPASTKPATAAPATSPPAATKPPAPAATKPPAAAPIEPVLAPTASGPAARNAPAAAVTRALLDLAESVPTPEPSGRGFGDGTVGRTLWDGDVGEGSLVNYAERLYDPDKEILRVESDPAGVPWHPSTGHSGIRDVIRMTVANDSRDRAYRSPKHRVQAASPLLIPVEANASAPADPAKVRYIGWAVFIPKSFPVFHRPGSVGWSPGGVDQKVRQNSIWSVYGPPFEGSGGLGARFAGSEPDQSLSIGADAGGRLWSMQAERGTEEDIAGRWIDVVVRVLMHAGSSKGRLQMWVNTGSGYTAVPLGDEGTTWTGATLNDAHDDRPNYSKVSVYVNDDAYNTPANPRGLATMYFAEHRIGTGFASVAPRSYG